MAERPDFPKMEEAILEFWRNEDIFRKTLEKPAPQGNFVFFEGPPTANGKPGIHHVEARAYKDIIPRYKTMRGFRVDRKAGWDTHGLPVEIEVEKKLGISGKQQIESIKATPRESIAHFNELCKKSVWTYLEDWNKLTERIGFWVDLERPYVTYYNEYMESLWWVVKQIHERGLLYQGYKVVPYCVRCGTVLSSHELAQGYKDVEDVSVVWKFPLRDDPQTSLLAWTTTPWSTLSTMGLSVNPDATYVKVRVGDEQLIFAKSRMEFVLVGVSGYEVVEEILGSNLVGLHYEPIAPAYKNLPEVQSNTNVYQVFAADYVELTEGTGIVTINGSYGEIDMVAARKNGLPIVMDVDLQGKFTSAAGSYAGTLVHDVTPLLVKDFTTAGRIWRTEPYLHSYPHCWRCKTKLIYYAKESWFVKMSALRDELVVANRTVNWLPDHIKEGRFGEWLREVKDWAFSRERYWGTPLPIWMCEKNKDHQKVIGGFQDFPESPSGNTYYILRHGLATTNAQKVVSAHPDAPHHLTEEGRRQVEERSRELAAMGGVDVIVASPVLRTRETAEIISAALSVPVNYDDRLLEIEFGVYEGKLITEYESSWKRMIDRFTTAPEGAENLTEVSRRMYSCLKDLDEKYRGQRILIVSHGDPLWVFEGALNGLSPQGLLDFAQAAYIQKGELRKITYRMLPRNANGFVDPHRPYVDDVTFACVCGGVMRRTPEVVDVWFDSGAMPFAQWHYPFEKKDAVDAGGVFPADYISEAIDQTRGWFYTLLAVSVLLDRGAPYKNVICLGHVVDAEGKKMSKSIGNVVDPWEMVNRFGADAVRFFMYTTSQPGDTKRFDPKDLDLIVKQTFMILWNVLAFWKLYASNKTTPHMLPPNERAQSGVHSQIVERGREATSEAKLPPTPSNIMDQWILARLGEVTKLITERLDAYDVTPAARAITEFVNDLSTWYVRRSRDRFKRGAPESVAVLGHVLHKLAKLMAPFTPFFAESLYREVGGSGSVHLADWPEAGSIDQKLLDEMDGARKFAELAHALRQEAGLKVRQPLAALEHSGNELRPEIRAILQDEVNVDVVRAGFTSPGDGMVRKEAGAITIALDTRMTPELRSRGMLRDITRQVNNLRKTQGLTIRDRIAIFYDTQDANVREVMEKYVDGLKAAALADSVQAGKTGAGTDLDIGEAKIWLGIQKT